MCWFARTSEGFRGWFIAESLGELIPDVPPEDFVMSVLAPDDGASIVVAVSQSTQLPGVYLFDIPSAFLIANGVGAYFVVEQVASEFVNAVMGAVLHVQQEDLDSMSAVLANVPAVADIVDGVWDAASADHTDAGSMGARMNLLDVVVSSRLSSSAQVDLTLLRKALTNRMETLPGNPGKLILYDDDTTTPIMMWNLTDSSNGAVAAVVGSPAKRAAGT